MGELGCYCQARASRKGRHRPHPNNAATAQQAAITAIVDKILAAKKADANADTKAWEAQIDALVYQLYGLTDEEIAIVEGAQAVQPSAAANTEESASPFI